MQVSPLPLLTPDLPTTATSLRLPVREGQEVPLAQVRRVVRSMRPHACKTFAIERTADDTWDHLHVSCPSGVLICSNVRVDYSGGHALNTTNPYCCSSGDFDVLYPNPFFRSLTSFQAKVGI